jgi:tetraacyldisaccharide 4'-kinase
VNYSWRKLLFPFSWIYQGVTSLRNKAFDWGIFESQSFSVPIICVGNLSVGGTGKTPMIECLVRQLSSTMEVAVLSRGYKRNSSGFQLFDSQSTVAQMGDEPFQLAQKYKNITVAVDANRRNGIEKLLLLRPNVEVVLLDDAFQHRWVASDLKILLTTYDNPYHKDCVLPSGNLRESQSGAHRADLIVVTKCPKELSSQSQLKFQNQLSLQANQSCFFATIGYASRLKGKETPSVSDFVKQDFVLVTGIANPSDLIQHLDSLGATYTHLSFSDHHHFSSKDVHHILKTAGQKPILTTEKDAVRLRSLLPVESLFELPIETVFLNDSKALTATIKQHLT